MSDKREEKLTKEEEQSNEKEKNKDVLILCDVDGTLTPSGQEIEAEVENFLFNKLLK